MLQEVGVGLWAVSNDPLDTPQESVFALTITAVHLAGSPEHFLKVPVEIIAGTFLTASIRIAFGALDEAPLLELDRRLFKV